MSVSRDAVGVCLLGDRLYAVGGYDGQVYLNTVEAYDPQTNEWTQVSLSISDSFCICVRFRRRRIISDDAISKTNCVRKNDMSSIFEMGISFIS